MNGNKTENTFDPSVLNELQEAIGSVSQIISIYLDDFPKNIAEMRTALEQHDYPTIGRLAHSLKSSSGNLGALELVNQSAELEAYMQQANPDDSTVSTSITKLEEVFKSVQPQLMSFIR